MLPVSLVLDGKVSQNMGYASGMHNVGVAFSKQVILQSPVTQRLTKGQDQVIGDER